MRKRKHITGFTVIELMFVMLIISIVLAILIPAVMGAIQSSRVVATRATILKIQGVLISQQDRFDKDMLRKNGWFYKRFNERYQPYNTTHIAERKMRFNELFLADVRIESAADSSELLYAIITEHNPEVANSFSGNEIGDTDGDGKLELLDAWGNPIRYYPHPTRIFRPNGYPDPISPTAARALYGEKLPPEMDIDSDDSSNLMNPNGFVTRFGYDPRTHHPILVVSAGPSGKLGLFEPHERHNNGHMAAPIPGATEDLYDNISNLDMR